MAQSTTTRLVTVQVQVSIPKDQTYTNEQLVESLKIKSAHPNIKVVGFVDADR